MGVQRKVAAKPLRYEAGPGRCGRCGRSVRLGVELQGGAAERLARSDEPHGRARAPQGPAPWSGASCRGSGRQQST